MAPEVAAGTPYDAKAEVWSLFMAWATAVKPQSLSQVLNILEVAEGPDLVKGVPARYKGANTTTGAAAPPFSIQTALPKFVAAAWK